MSDLSRPRGTRDFLPSEMSRRRIVEGRMRDVLSRRGYGEVQTPTFEHADLFIARSGPQVLEQIYDFRDKGDRHMALRPELTAPVMRFYASDLRNQPKPLRVFYFGNCFRYERPQKGRYREFWQMGSEYIGKRTAVANAEVIDAAIEAITAAGVGSFKVRIGHVSLLGSLLKDHGVDPSKDKDIMIAIDKKDRVRLAQMVPARDDIDIAPLLDLITGLYEYDDALGRIRQLRMVKPEVTDACDELETVLTALYREDLEILFDPSISRGLDYYDGVVFEIEVPSLGAEKQVCGGGAYSLSSVLGSEVEGIGFGIGFDRIMMALEGEVRPPRKVRSFYVIPIGERAVRSALAAQRSIASFGFDCILEAQGRNLRKAISFAVSCGMTHLVIVGEDEIEKGVLTIKDLGDSGQVTVGVDGLSEYLRSIHPED